MAGSSKIELKIVGDASDVEKAFRQASRSAQRFSVSFGQIAKSAVGFAAVTAGLRGLGSALRAGVSEFAEQQKVAAQTLAVIQSTGAAAGVTAKQVDRLADSVASYSGIDDEAVKAGQNLLLTFTNVQNRVGKGNDVFSQATKAIADLSVAMGTDMSSAALTVGKALNDPEKGLTRLQRIGVAFSKSQVAAIKGFSQTGQVAKAQQVILAELNREFGGSAAAFGKTIPGQLARLKETLLNVSGDLVGRLAPAFSAALDAGLRFVDGLSKADGLKAKLRFVLSNAQTIGRDLFRQLEQALSRVDFAAVVQTVQEQLAAGLNRIGEFLNRVDFSRLGQGLGEAIGRGVSGAAAYLRTVNWEQVGNAIVNGIGDFLKGVDWVGLFRAVFRLAVAALRAAAGLLRGVSKAIGRGILRALGDGMRSAIGFVRQQALRVALEIVDALDFKIFGRTIIPGLSALKKRIGKELDEIARKTEESAGRIAAAARKVVEATGNPGVRGTAGRPIPVATSAVRKPAVDLQAGARAAEKQSTAADLAKAAAAKAAAAALKAREAFDRLLDGLQLGLERAQVTSGLKDDLRELRKIQSALRERIKVEKDSVDLQRQLFQNEQEILGVQREQAQRRANARQAAQFRALGLTASGDTRIPGARALRAQLARVGDAVKGTFLDTGKTQSLLARIRKVMSGGLGKVGDDVRAKVKEILDGIDQQLKDHAKTGPLTKTTALNANKLLAGLGLDRDTLRELRARLSGFNSAGQALAAAPGTVGAFGMPLAVSGTTVVHTQVNLDGRPLTTVVTKHQQTKNRRNPPQTRGRNF